VYFVQIVFVQRLKQKFLRRWKLSGNFLVDNCQNMQIVISMSIFFQVINIIIIILHIFLLGILILSALCVGGKFFAVVCTVLVLFVVIVFVIAVVTKS